MKRKRVVDKLDMDINVIKQILVYYVGSIYHERRGLKTRVLRLRLVSKKWKRAIESVDWIWTRVFTTPIITKDSKHIDTKNCNGWKHRKNTTKYRCKALYHWTNLRWDNNVNFYKDIYDKKRRRVYKRTKEALDTARYEVERLEREMKFLEQK